MKYQHEYKYSVLFSTEYHTWTCVSGRGGVHLSISVPLEGQPLANLEFHFRAPRNSDDAPSHNQCWLLHAPCWHDGTSLYARERFLPRWERQPHDHDEMFILLEAEYERCIAPPDAPEPKEER